MKTLKDMLERMIEEFDPDCVYPGSAQNRTDPGARLIIKTAKTVLYAAPFREVSPNMAECTGCGNVVHHNNIHTCVCPQCALNAPGFPHGDPGGEK